MPPNEAPHSTAVAAYSPRDREANAKPCQGSGAAEPPRAADLGRAGAPTQATYSRAAYERKRFASQKRLAELYPDLWSVATLQRWRTLGIGPPWVVAGPRRIAYDLDEVEAWLASRKATSTADAKERGLAS
jgi:hypothetical protein